MHGGREAAGLRALRRRHHLAWPGESQTPQLLRHCRRRSSVAWSRTAWAYGTAGGSGERRPMSEGAGTLVVDTHMPRGLMTVTHAPWGPVPGRCRFVPGALCLLCR